MRNTITTVACIAVPFGPAVLIAIHSFFPMLSANLLIGGLLGVYTSGFITACVVAPA